MVGVESRTSWSYSRIYNYRAGIVRQFNHLTKTFRFRESPQETEAGVQIALDQVDHFAMEEETRVSCRIANLLRPKQESQIEDRTGLFRQANPQRQP